MDTIDHHLPALYAVIALLLVPAMLAVVWRLLVRRQQRLARDAMFRGNVLHRDWLAQSEGARQD